MNQVGRYGIPSFIKTISCHYGNASRYRVNPKSIFTPRTRTDEKLVSLLELIEDEVAGVVFQSCEYDQARRVLQPDEFCLCGIDVQPSLTAPLNYACPPDLPRISPWPVQWLFVRE